MGDISIIFAFLGGVVSFLSPCVLPIIPGFLAYLAGSSLENPSREERREMFINSLFFVLGFSLIFAILGVLLNTVLEAIAYDVQNWLARIGGIIIIFFGIYLTGIIKVPFLEKEHKVLIKRKFKSKYLTSFIFGLAFAVGWTPCVGAALGAILGLAASQPGAAFILLFAYSLGLGLPFIITAIFAAGATKLIKKVGPWLKYVMIIFGIILIILGVLVFTQLLSRVADFSILTMLLSR
ncbi:MAG: cytochrome C biogenesis protein [Candidatus Magasanikbacteria bacterium]|jgi:cytochrome c-type biogenesis protein|nr:cytochrome C biogenesis protein [Candidatus Magasanikbacteria bacterium]MBT4221272.1 cytochrome C biogenesis protein [Candidatus Magasanikbacteria bacterium]MBT4350418.1 cytochrome C biogenesis protein [Candidatus Magasanikbacteria bacterium]MBT4542035.1 cytochrome C biogenesis protein [Candidatus Magasanikbacteria bacterium]MBT6253396.1 cytochrome C biogenesis protein [Candidatus Magasanikbacteria bacterium]